MNIIKIDKYKSVKEKYQAVMVILIFLIIFSFTIEGLISVRDLTIPLLLILGFVVILYFIKTREIYSIDRCDIYIYIFIMYMLFHSLIISDSKSVIIVILASFAPYFLGRYIEFNNKLYKIAKYTVNIIGWIIVVKLISEYSLAGTGNRVGIEGSNVIANGELLGIFSLINLFGLTKINKDFWSIFNYIVGILTCLIILGSRGTVFAIIITTIIMYMLISGNKIKTILYSIGVFITYIIAFSENSILLNIFPVLSRFSIYGIANDQSIIGSSSGDGRYQLWLNSIDAFKEKPFMGIGVGEIYSHNIFLEILATLGAIAVIIFIIWTISMLIKCKKISKYNTVIVALFIYTFVYRQSSFALNAHKSLFFLGAMVVTSYREMLNEKCKTKNLQNK